MNQSVASPATPAFAKVALTIEIARPIDVVWPLIGGFGIAGRFLNVAIILDGNETELGSLRRVGADIVEVLVGLSRYSYCYAQTEGPMARYAYHGCVTLESSGDEACRLDYTIVFDQSSMDEAERTHQLTRLAGRFEGMIQAMKTEAEAH